MKNKKGKLAWYGKFRATPNGNIWDVPSEGKPKVLGKWKGTEEEVKLLKPHLNFNGYFGQIEVVLVSLLASQVTFFFKFAPETLQESIGTRVLLNCWSIF